MDRFNRRDFLKSAGTLAISGMVIQSGSSLATAASGVSENGPVLDNAVRFFGDGLSLSPREYSDFLTRLTNMNDFEKDIYAKGGVIKKLETKFAKMLGKETAVFLPTGTLANHIALRRLVGSRKRVIVQSDSHLYNDSGDCTERLSGINLLPVEGQFNLEAIKKELERARQGRVKSEIGAISLESPLRRGFNTVHSVDQVSEISKMARSEGIGLHLDGARLFMQASHFGYNPVDFSDYFDTIYVSLYKNFNAAGGAILAGPKETLADLFHERRMFGGSPCHAWPLASVAMFFLDGFLEEYRRAKNNTDQLISHLGTDHRFVFQKISQGSNGLWLNLNKVDQLSFINNLLDRDIHLMNPRPGWKGILLMINPTIAKMNPEKLAEEFKNAAR